MIIRWGLFPTKIIKTQLGNSDLMMASPQILVLLNVMCSGHWAAPNPEERTRRGAIIGQSRLAKTTLFISTLIPFLNAAALGGIEIVNPADARSPNAQEWMIKLVGPYAKMYKNMDQIPIEGDLSPDSTIDEVFMAIYEFLENSPEERDRY